MLTIPAHAFPHRTPLELFAAGARRRAIAEAGVPGAVTEQEAEALLLAAERFVAVVADALALTYRSPAALSVA